VGWCGRFAARSRAVRPQCGARGTPRSRPGYVAAPEGPATGREDQSDWAVLLSAAYTIAAHAPVLT
jgi:hypothetical protein